jgi:hypothetical protein
MASSTNLLRLIRSTFSLRNAILSLSRLINPLEIIVRISISLLRISLHDWERVPCYSNTFNQQLRQQQYVAQLKRYPAYQTNFAVADPGVNNAIFRYIGAPLKEPTTNATTSVNSLVEANLVPLINPGAPGGSNPPDVALNLQIGLNVGGSSLTSHIEKSKDRM